MGQHFVRRPWYRRSRASAVIGALVVLVVAGGVLTRRSLAGDSPPRPRAANTATTLAIEPAIAAAGSQPNPTADTATTDTVTTKAAHRGRTTGARSGPATFVGPDGVEAAWVVAENARPGTTGWQIGPTTSGPPISGYLDHTSASRGQHVSLYVSTAASRFHVEAYRMGYYRGDGARLVWRSPLLSGLVQDTCPVTAVTYTVHCSWTRSASFDIGPAWVQGDYLLKLVADTGRSSYVPLTVTDPTSTATYVIQNSVLTWQAWNPYGGYDCFQGPTGQLGPTDPIRSRVVSYDRPYQYEYSDGHGAADFVNLEYPAVRFAEEHGLDVTYWTDIDLATHPTWLRRHRVLISLGHNEFWTGGERAALVQGQTEGVNLMFLGATPGLRPARLTASPLGADREMVAYRDAQADPIVRTDPQLTTANQWSDPPLDKPNSEVVGNTYGGYGINASMVVTDPRAWPFAHTGVTRGTKLAHLILGDYDHYVAGQPGPTDVQILAHSPVTTSYGHTDDADMIYYTDPTSQAGVFSTGTIGWVGFLNTCGPGVPCPTVQTITANVLRLFGGGPAGRREPSVRNTAQSSSSFSAG